MNDGTIGRALASPLKEVITMDQFICQIWMGCCVVINRFFVYFRSYQEYKDGASPRRGEQEGRGGVPCWPTLYRWPQGNYAQTINGGMEVLEDRSRRARSCGAWTGRWETTLPSFNSTQYFGSMYSGLGGRYSPQIIWVAGPTATQRESYTSRARRRCASQWDV